MKNKIILVNCGGAILAVNYTNPNILESRISKKV
jgi:hypothetical protein